MFAISTPRSFGLQFSYLWGTILRDGPPVRGRFTAVVSFGTFDTSDTCEAASCWVSPDACDRAEAAFEEELSCATVSAGGPLGGADVSAVVLIDGVGDPFRLSPTEGPFDVMSLFSTAKEPSLEH